MASSDFCAVGCIRWQTGLADMSIVRSTGLSPVKLTLPVMVAPLLRSGVAVPPSPAGSFLADSLASSLLDVCSLAPPQPARNIPAAAANVSANVFFISSLIPGSRARAGSQPGEFFRGELEHVADQQVRVVLLIPLETGRHGSGENVMAALL